LAADDTSIYWTVPMTIEGWGKANIPGSIMKMPIAGGAPTTLFTGAQLPGGLALDSTSVYWTDTFAGTVMKVAKSCGEAVTLASGLGGHMPGELVVDTKSIYWADTAGLPGAVAVNKVSVAGGPVVNLAPFQPNSQEAMAIAIDAANVYWTNFLNDGSGSITSVPLGGGAVTTLVSLVKSWPTGLAVDATGIYFPTFDGTSGAIMTAPLNGGTPTTLASAQNEILGFAVDTANVYWATYAQAGAVMRMPVGGGMPTVLASTSWPSSLVVDSTSVYWATDKGSSVIMRLSPK
jgi:hypothetical protein